MEVLAAFSQEHEIAFAMLSDRGSETIKRLGLLNRHVAEQQAYYNKPVTERHEGLPYPGTFLLDESGTVVDRQFERSYRVRPSATLSLEDLLGSAVGESEVSAQAQALGLQALAWLDTQTYRPQQNLRLHLSLEVDPGLHVYAPPTPSGFTPLHVELAPFEGLVAEPASLPAGRPFAVEGIDEDFVVYEGRLQIPVSFRIEKNLGPVELDVRVHYQACSDTVCHPPGELRMLLALEGRDVLRP